MNDNKRIWVWVGVAVVIVGIFLIFVWPAYHTPTPLAVGPQPVYAPSGQLIPGFPPSLVLNALQAPTSSYSIAYGSSTNEYAAVFNSSGSVEFLYNDYLNYFLQGNWTITNNQNGQTNATLAATTGTGSALVSIVRMDPASSQVSIGYQTK